MKKLIVISILFAFALTSATSSFARSGCCSHHGGVAGCGCADGSPLSQTCLPYYPQCSAPVQNYSSSTPYPTATLTPTSKPIIKKIIKKKRFLKPTPTPKKKHRK